MMLELVIYTEPVAQGRPRFTRISGYPRAYEPAKSRQAKHVIQQQVRGIVRQPFTKDVHVELRFFRPLTKELARKVAKGMIKTPIFAGKKPDIDNYVKLTLDALSGIVWTDDAKVVTLFTGKYYDEIPRIEIKVKEINDNA